MKRPKVIVLGYMFRDPIGGVLWQTLHYILGLRRLGFDVYYGECHGQWLVDPIGCQARKLLERFGFSDRWFCWQINPNEPPICFDQTLGMSREEFTRACGEAEAIFNLSAYHLLHLHDFLTLPPRRVYLETDPVVAQLRLSKGDPHFVRLLEPHNHFFTFGENIGAADCQVPRTQYSYHTTRQPILCDMWESAAVNGQSKFTTVGQWRQDRKLKKGGQIGDEIYYWSKHLEFLKFIELPRRTSQRFELALGEFKEEDRLLLENNGWGVMDSGPISATLENYHDYICASRGEFTVAKDMNVRLRSGWFSDRSACYLAAGKPVINQDTAFDCVLPTGEGLFAFRTLDDILAAVDAINTDYPRHCRAAREIAAEYFDAPRVLGAMVEKIGLGVESPVG